MKLIGKNLGERQRDFNTKVNDAINKKINFDVIRDFPVDSDIDQLFKIDIASRHKDVQFLLHTLISGDSLYITRALKSVWLFDDEYQHIVNPDYLSKNIFPQMSSKMMKKLLTTASIWIKDEERAKQFYLYCKGNDMPNVAVKFLVSTAEEFKESVLQNDFGMIEDLEEDIMVQFIIGCSFKLANLYLSKAPQESPNRVLHQLRFLYSVDSDKYLNMLESYYNPFTYSSHRFGLRISKEIFKKHKERILKHPRVYVMSLNKSSIAKYSNSEDAKLFLKTLLPKDLVEFWDCWNGIWYDYIHEHEFIIKNIPLSERHGYFKKIYDEKYGSAFEMNLQFYERKYYVHMTKVQQEKWALDQLASKKEMLGAGQDFLWYKFVKFDLAFEEIKKLILITKNDDKRLNMLCVLVESAKNLSELEKLLSYFYERHVNEMEKFKNSFLTCVINNHNIFSMDQNCWNFFNKILYSLDVYNAQNLNYNIHNFKLTVLFYSILHGIKLPEVLRCWVIENFYAAIPSDMEMKIEQFNSNGLEIIYKYILQIYLDEMYNLEKRDYDGEVRTQADKLICHIQQLRNIFHITTDDLPEIVTKFKKLNPNVYYPKIDKTEEFSPVTPQEFIRMLKKDATLVLDFDFLERNIQYRQKYNLKELLQKLRIYFHNDTAKEYLEYFRHSYMKEDCKVIFASVFGIFLLADEKFRTKFILQHAPEDSKVQFDQIDRTELYIREAICRFVCYSRPPVEIDNILKYIKGDYLKYCLPMFNVYMTRYPPAIRMKFVKSLLNTPVSIQKHGIRLAFQCFKTEELIDLILKSWKKYQNVSLRMVIYECVFASVKKNEAKRKEMFKVLKKITLDLKEDEVEEVMKIVIQFRELPHYLKGFYLCAIWTAISKFSDSQINIEAKTNIIRIMTDHVNDVPKETVKKIVTSHVEQMLVNNKIIPDSERSKYKSYDDAAWDLTHAFICKYCKDEDILELIKLIINKCIERWNDVHFANFCCDFIDSLIDRSFYLIQNVFDFNRVLESVLAYLSDSIPKCEIFVLILNLKIVILTNRVSEYAFSTYKNCEVDEEELQDIAKEYAKEIENFVREMIKSKLFSAAFTNFLSEVIVKNFLRTRMVPNLPKSMNKKMIISVTSYLADSDMVEILLLAVALSFGLSCNENDEEWKDFTILRNKLAKIDIDEIQYFINIKSRG